MGFFFKIRAYHFFLAFLLPLLYVTVCLYRHVYTIYIAYIYIYIYIYILCIAFIGYSGEYIVTLYVTFPIGSLHFPYVPGTFPELF